MCKRYRNTMTLGRNYGQEQCAQLAIFNEIAEINVYPILNNYELS